MGNGEEGELEAELPERWGQPDFEAGDLHPKQKMAPGPRPLPPLKLRKREERAAGGMMAGADVESSHRQPRTMTSWAVERLEAIRGFGPLCRRRR